MSTYKIIHCPNWRALPTSCASKGLEDEGDLIRGVREHFELGKSCYLHAPAVLAAITSAER
jgi:hypothetical protein